MSYFKNFDIRVCFEDACRHILFDDEPKVVSIHELSTAKLGSFADSRFTFLRPLAFNAYRLTADFDFRGHNAIIKAFKPAEFIEMLAYKTALLVEQVENDRNKFPSLKGYARSRRKKGERLILENILLNAIFFDNPQVSWPPMTKFLEALGKNPQTPAPFGALALTFYDEAIEFFKANDVGRALQCLYRAQNLVDEGNLIVNEARVSGHFKGRARLIAAEGGEARAKKYKALEEETIRLYLAGTWKSVPSAAHEITPKIVALSKNGNGDLLPTTTKPLEWIRAYKRRNK